LSALLEIGLLERDGEELCLTPRGEEVAEVTEGGLPVALRRAVTEECAAVRDRQMRGRCVTAEVVTEGSDIYFTGTLTDGNAPLLELRLQAGGEKQAESLKRRFEKDAEAVLQGIWELLTN
jgi:hypothetical protein